jgi:hypothetical protein
MSTITYDIAGSAPAKAASPAAPVRKRMGLFARIMESRQRQAEEHLARRGLRLPRELEDAGLKISSRNEDSLPFIR